VSTTRAACPPEENIIAVVIPIIAAYSGAVAAGAAIAAGTFTVAGALTAMGGMFAAAGLLANDKDAQKLGSTLGALGGVANMLGFGSSGAGASAASESANQADLATEAADAIKEADALEAAGRPIGSVGSDLGQTTLGAADIVQPTQMGPQAIERAALAQQANPSAGIAETLTGSQPNLLEQFSTQPVQPTQGPLSQAASNMTQQDVVQWLDNATKKGSSLMGQAWDGAGSLLGKAGAFAKDNPELTKMALGAIQGAYGPQQQAFDYQKGLMERARQNQNTPIRLKYQQPAGS
jgi:hypothetical protein